MMQEIKIVLMLVELLSSANKSEFINAMSLDFISSSKFLFKKHMIIYDYRRESQKTLLST